MQTPVLAVASAVVAWPHRRSVTAHCLVRLRTIALPGPHGPRPATAVVVSQLRSSPRGGQISSDFAGVAVAVDRHLLPRDVAPDEITWYAHHGGFSSWDDTGPETLTRISLSGAGSSYRDDRPRAAT